jgi:hypothetical protein
MLSRVQVKVRLFKVLLLVVLFQHTQVVVQTIKYTNLLLQEILLFHQDLLYQIVILLLLVVAVVLVLMATVEAAEAVAVVAMEMLPCHL